MGKYFDPVEIEENARRLDGTRKYNRLVAQLEDGERLAGLYDRSIYKAAPHLYSQEEFDEFDKAYKRGLWVSCAFYATREEPV